MSNSYEIDGVTVTPGDGGWYTLTHSTLPEPVKAQGKENADAKAAEIAKGAKEGGSMEPQSMSAIEQASASASALAGEQADPNAGMISIEEAEKLRAQVQEMSDARNEAEARAAKAESTVEQLQTKTVTTDGGAVPDAPQRVPAGVPRQFEGPMDDKAKARLAKMGLNIVRIVLEENENIPPTGLFVGHNGRGYMIKPGEEVDVPDFLLGVLDDAVMSSPVTDSKTQKVLGYRNRSRYPYRRITN